MNDDIIELVTQAVQQVVPADTQVPAVQLQHTKDPQHGDLATNIALVLAKSLGKNPRELANDIIAALPAHATIAKAEVAGPGFINVFLTNDSATAIINQALKAGAQFGFATADSKEKIYLEYMSANPTGPLHVGHGRSAAFGSALANLLRAGGYQVHTEYYVNDAGRQMNILALSVWLRYLLVLGEQFTFPEHIYQGEYVIEVAKRLERQAAARLQKSWAEITDSVNVPAEDKDNYIDALIQAMQILLGDTDFAMVHRLGLDTILADIKVDLAEFGVTFDRWYHESELVKQDALKKVLATLKEKQLTFEKDGALWFKSTAFGDDKDRVLLRDNGEPTYFANDAAYHLYKYQQQFDQYIDIFGADHHGYVPRMRAYLEGLGEDTQKFLVLLVQFAVLYRGTEKVQMSTRSGKFVTLRELREEVGTNAARYYYVMRKPEQHLDFDLEQAKSKSNDNPVYYIQYAHARICSVFRQLAEQQLTWNQAQGTAELGRLTSTYEDELIRALNKYPDLVARSSKNREPHVLAHFLHELAGLFHSYYNAEKFIIDDVALRNARLCLVKAVQAAMQSGLAILGISAPEQM